MLPKLDFRIFVRWASQRMKMPKGQPMMSFYPPKGNGLMRNFKARVVDPFPTT